MKFNLKYSFLIYFLAVSPILHAQKSKGDQYFDEAKKELNADGDSKKVLKLLSSARAEYLKESNYYRYFVATQSLIIYYQDTHEGQSAESLVFETAGKIPKNNNDNLELHAKLQDNLAYTYLAVLDRPDDALKAYSESIRIYQSTGNHTAADLGFEFLNRAATHQSLFQFQQAADDLLQAIAVYDKDPETTPAQKAENYLSLGTNYNEMDAYEKAIPAFNNGISLLEGTDASELRAKLFNDLGITYNKQGKYPQAITYFQKAKSINEQLFGKDEAHYSLNLINTGNAFKDMGNLEDAMAEFQEALAIYQKTPPSEMTRLIDLILDISRVTDELGMLDQSQALLDKAHQLAIDTYGENSLEEADVIMSLAVTAFDHGEFDLSLNYNFKALSILQERKFPSGREYAMIYNNIGQAYDELNDIPLALQYKNQALDLYTKLLGTQHPSVAMAIGNIGLTYEMEGSYDKALDYLQKSLAVRLKTQAPDHEDVGTTYLNIGLVSLKKIDGPQAVAYLEKAKVIFDPYKKHSKKAMVYNRLAAAYELNRQAIKVNPALQQALIANTLNFDNTQIDSYPDNPDFLDYYEILVSYIGKASAFTSQGDKAGLLLASKHLEAADKILKDKALRLGSARDRLELAQLNAFFTEAGLKLTDKLFQTTKDPVHFEKAFYYSERSKANELFADIQNSQATSLSRVPKKLLEQRKRLTTRMNSLQQQLAAAYASGDQPLMTRIKAQEFDLSKEFSALESTIINQAPAYAAMSGGHALPTWREIKMMIGPKTALVSYTLTDSAKYVLVGNGARLVMKALDTKVDFEKLVRGYVNQIKFQSASTDMREQLTRLLWEPVESALAELGPVETLIIIPDGPLHYLPFEALGKGSFLLEKYAIYYQVSGAMMVSTQPRTLKNKPSFIAMAPVFEDKSTNYINKSCERFVSQAKKTDPATRAFSLNGDYIAPLPATEKEVEQINQIHADKGVFTKYFTREAASEELIKKGELAEFDYIHFATHGFVNSSYPELSGLLLTQDAQSPEDGILYTGEILGLSLKAELVTLSACETALGKKIEGEGVRGLTTAFLFAGARSVIASLWKVADESTAQLMIAFYTELLSGKDKATALRLAKLGLLKDQKYSSPYYWAPFVMIGGN